MHSYTINDIYISFCSLNEYFQFLFCRRSIKDMYSNTTSGYVIFSQRAGKIRNEVHPSSFCPMLKIGLRKPYLL